MGRKRANARRPIDRPRLHDKLHDKMHAMGLEQVPCTESLACIFREADPRPKTEEPSPTS